MRAQNFQLHNKSVQDYGLTTSLLLLNVLKVQIRSVWLAVAIGNIIKQEHGNLILCTLWFTGLNDLLSHFNLFSAFKSL